MSRRLKILLAFAAGLVLLALSLYGIDVAEVRRCIAAANAAWVAGASVLYLSAYFVRSLRWRLVLRPVQKVSVGEGFWILMAGYFLNYVIPIRAGEVAKSFFLKRLKGVPIATSLPTVFVDKLLELVSIVFVLLMVPVLSISIRGSLAVLIYVVLGVFVAALGIVVLAFTNQEAITRLLSAVFAWLPGHIHRKLTDWIGLFVKGMGVARHNLRTLPALLGLTALAVVLDAVYFLFMFKAFSVDVAFPTVLFGYTLLTLSYILPTPPAQIGYNELVIGLIFAGGLAGAHIARDQVMAVVIVAHALTGLLITGVGLGGFWAMGIRVSDSFRRMARSASSGADAVEAPDER